MKKVISEKKLHSIIRRSIMEAMKYDKERRQYYPDYTGNPHSDAGKYTAKNRDDYEYSRNDYKWHNPEHQKRFNDLQWEKDGTDSEPIDKYDIPDWENERKAEEYLDRKDASKLVQQAIEDTKPKLANLMDELYQQATQKYPMLKQDQYKDDFIYNLCKSLDEYM